MINPVWSKILLEAILNIDFRDNMGTPATDPAYKYWSEKINPFTHQYAHGDTNQPNRITGTITANLIRKFSEAGGGTSANIFPDEIYLGLLIDAPVLEKDLPKYTDPNDDDYLYYGPQALAQLTDDQKNSVVSYVEPVCGQVDEEGHPLESGQYKRILLTNKGEFGFKILQTPTLDEITITVGGVQETRVVAKVTNSLENIPLLYSGSGATKTVDGQEVLVEPHAGYRRPTKDNTIGAIDDIKYFGLFTKEKDASGFEGKDIPSLIIYGPLQQQIQVKPNEVPIILRNNLEITLG